VIKPRLVKYLILVLVSKIMHYRYHYHYYLLIPRLLNPNHNNRQKSKTPKGKKGGSGSKSAKITKSKSCKLKKSSKNFKIEGYNTYNNMTLKKNGSTSFLEPAVDNILAYNIADSVSICLEDAIVECSRRCNEEDGKCTTFEVIERDPTDVPQYRCTLINNNENEFNQKGIYPTSELSLIARYVYNNKLAPPLKVEVTPEGLYPPDPDSEDFKTLAKPVVGCVGTRGLTNPTFNETLFNTCADCFISQAFQVPTCVSVVAGICGGVDDRGRVLNFFSDDTCGQVCFAGKASNYACLSKLQTYVLAAEGQAFIKSDKTKTGKVSNPSPGK